MPPSETALEQTRRHVVEGWERIAKQKALVARLAQGAEINRALLAQAQEFLAELQGFQELGCEHLARESNKQATP